MILIGHLGDRFDPKFILNISLGIIATLLVCIGMITLYIQQGLLFYMLLFSINGFVQAAGWPLIVHIFSNWFGKSGRGACLGLFTSAGSAGNIMGAALTSIFTSQLGYSWHMTIAMVGFICLVQVVLNIVFLIEHPKDKGFVVEEMDEDLLRTEQILERGIGV